MLKNNNMDTLVQLLPWKQQFQPEIPEKVHVSIYGNKSLRSKACWIICQPCVVIDINK